MRHIIVFFLALSIIPAIYSYTKQDELFGAPLTRFERTLVPETDSTYEIGSTTKAWLTGYFDRICLTGDSCETAWPAGTSGGGGGLFSYSAGTDTITPIVASTSNSAILRVASVIATSTTATNTFPWLTSTNAAITGKFYADGSPGASSSVLQSTATGIRWTSTTTLGFTDTNTTYTASSPLRLSGTTFGAEVATATALTANGANCSSGSFPLGVDASGASETCTDAWTEAENTSAGYIANINGESIFDLSDVLGSSAASGTVFVSDGTNWNARATSTLNFPAGGGTADGVSNWLTSAGALRPSSTIGLYVNSSSTFTRLNSDEATSTNLAVTNAFNFLGTVITNVATWFSGLFDTNFAAKSVDGLTDVDTTGHASGTVLVSNGTTWFDRATSTLGIIASDIRGILAIANGGTGLSSVGASGTIMVSDGTAVAYRATSTLGIAGTSYTFGDALTETAGDVDFDGGASPGGELGNTWASPTIDDSLAVTSWNLTTPTLTSFFGTPCSGNDFLQDISDTGAFTCVTATGGGGGSLSTTTDNNDQSEIVSYLTSDFYIGGSSSSTAEFNFDKDSARFRLSSTTASATGTITSTQGALTLGSPTEQVVFDFNTSNNWIVKTFTGITKLVLSALDLEVPGLTATNATSTNFWLTGKYTDTTNSPGTAGQLLRSTATSTVWTSTSTLGFGVLKSLNALTADVQTFASSTSGTDFGIESSGGTHTFRLPTVSSSARGVLTATQFLNLGNQFASTSISTSALLAGLLSDETGTAGNAVFSTNPLLAGFRSSASSTIGDGTAQGGLTVAGTATTTDLIVTTGINLFGGGSKTTANALCIQLTGDAGLCDSNDAGGGTGDGVSNWLFNGTRLTPSTTAGIVVLASSTISEINFTSASGTAASSTNMFAGIGNFVNLVVRTLATFLNVVVTGLLDIGDGVLEIPNGTGPTVDSIGEMALDSTANQLLIATSSTDVGVIPTVQYSRFTYASTSWSGTTTIRWGGPAMQPIKFQAIDCVTNAGTASLVAGSGVASTSVVNVTTATGTDAFGIAFTANEVPRFDVGTPSSASSVSCTLRWVYDRQ